MHSLIHQEFIRASAPEPPPKHRPPPPEPPPGRLRRRAARRLAAVAVRIDRESARRAIA